MKSLLPSSMSEVFLEEKKNGGLRGVKTQMASTQTRQPRSRVLIAVHESRSGHTYRSCSGRQSYIKDTQVGCFPWCESKTFPKGLFVTFIHNMLLHLCSTLSLLGVSVLLHISSMPDKIHCSCAPSVAHYAPLQGTLADFTTATPGCQVPGDVLLRLFMVQMKQGSALWVISTLPKMRFFWKAGRFTEKKLRVEALK